MSELSGPGRGNAIGISIPRVKTTDKMTAAVIFVIDHCSGDCLAIDVVEEETAAAWGKLVERAVRFAFGALQPGVAQGVQIRCDNLPAYRSKSFTRPLEGLGIRTSYISPLAPTGNGLAERFVRTLKDNRLAVQFYATLQELGDVMKTFRDVYNSHYILQRWGYRTPSQVRELFQEG